VTPLGRIAAAGLALFLAGCAAHAGSAGAPAASVNVGGVEIGVTANAWRGWPTELPRLVTPVLVRLANRGDVPVRVDPRTFALTLPDGRLAAMLPADVRGMTPAPAPAALAQAGAALGPTRERSGAGWALNEPSLDPRVDPSHEPDRTWELPSADMLALALPDGLLAPGREVSGFVYFERAPRQVRETTLTWPVVDVTGAPLGVATVPLGLR
jgi:hypothetical protein